VGSRGSRLPTLRVLPLRTLCSRKALFEDGAFTSVPRGSGPVSSEAERRLHLWGWQLDLLDGMETGDPLSPSSPGKSAARSVGSEARSAVSSPHGTGSTLHLSSSEEVDSLQYEELLEVVTCAVAKLSINWPAESQAEPQESKLDECFLRFFLSTVVAQDQGVLPEGKPTPHDQDHAAMPTCSRHVEETLVLVSGPGAGSSLSLRNASDGRIPHQLAHQILVWSQDKLLSLSAVHVPGQGPRPGEWMLHRELVKQIWRVFSQAQVDLFATRENLPWGWMPWYMALGVASEGAHLLASGLSTEVVETILQSGAPSTRKLYALKWKLFTSWCGHHLQDPVNCPVGTVLEFLQDRLSAGLTHSTLKVYVVAISACHAPLGGLSMGKNPLVACFLCGALRMRPPVRPRVPSWDLSMVLEAHDLSYFRPFAPLPSGSLISRSLTVCVQCEHWIHT
ncbi:hypothetical protein M9458_016558, partial [Cirrhinus mrigala]